MLVVKHRFPSEAVVYKLLNSMAIRPDLLEEMTHALKVRIKAQRSYHKHAWRTLLGKVILFVIFGFLF
jgi:hypothetical protein